MIVVYNGSLNRINYKGVRFDQGIPTFVTGELEKFVLGNRYFTKYVKKEKETPIIAPPILVKLPLAMTHVLAAIRTILLIRKLFPKCSIVLSAAGKYKVLFSAFSFISFVNYITPNALLYYRIFDLCPKSNAQHYTGMHVKVNSYEQLALRCAGLFDPKQDSKEKHFKLELKKNSVVIPYLLIIKKGQTEDRTFGGLGVYLEKELKINIRILESGVSKDLDKEIELINNATYIVSTGESELSYLAAFLGKAILVFIPDTLVKIESQYDIFENVTWSYIQSGGYDIYKKILEKLEDDIIKMKIGTAEAAKVAEVAAARLADVAVAEANETVVAGTAVFVDENGSIPQKKKKKK